MDRREDQHIRGLNVDTDSPKSTSEPLADLKNALDIKVLMERITEIRYREEHYGSSIGGRTVDADKLWLCEQLEDSLNKLNKMKRGDVK